VRTVEAERADPGSMLNLYREALRIRRAEESLGDGPLRWLEAPAGVLAFARDPGIACVTNLSGVEIPLPEHEEILIASDPLSEKGELRRDTTVWLRLSV
jgi:alpha-glucosidase